MRLSNIYSSKACLTLTAACCLLSLISIAWGIPQEKPAGPDQAPDREIIKRTRSYIDARKQASKGLADEAYSLPAYRRASAAITLYEQGRLKGPEPYLAKIAYAEKSETWVMAFSWISDDNIIPRIEAFDAAGKKVGEFESRPYPPEELPNTLVRSRMVKVSGPNQHAAPADVDLPTFNVKVPPSEIVSLYFSGPGCLKYVGVDYHSTDD